MSEQKKRFARCEHCPRCKMVEGNGSYYWGCFCLPFRGMPVAEIKKCPIMKEEK